MFAAVVVAFLPALRNQFVDWDDTDNFVRNVHYRGLGPAELRWMFTTFHMGHFQPLTWLTLGLDYTWARSLLGDGMDPRAYHFTNTLLHAANAAVFFFVAMGLLGRARVGRAASPRARVLAAVLAALFFGLHPLRVESVAWATERRDLLSTLFLLLAVLAYLRWNRAGARREPRWYGVAFGLFLLGLLSKVSVVVLPAIFLVLDAYPLGRITRGKVRRAVVEKIPFFALSLVFGAVATLGQARNHWLYTLDQHPLDARVAQSLYGIAFYVWKTVLPFGLLPIYEMHFPVSPLEPRFVAAAPVVVVAAAALVLLRKRAPGLVAAAAAYVIVLAPVVGIAQNGPQVVADRYSYVSCMGWAMVAAGGALALTARGAARAVVAAGAAVIVALGALTWRQCLVWRSTASLWTYTAARAPESSIAQNGYGYVLLEAGRVVEAIPVLRRAVQIQPSNEKAHHNLWRALKESGGDEELIAAYRESIRVLPDPADAHYNLANARMRQGDPAAAIASYEAAIRLRPAAAQFHGALAVALFQQGDLGGAERENRRAVEADPALALARYNLAVVLRRLGRTAEAIEELRRALGVRPDYAEARRLLEQMTSAPSGEK